jgi:hypothetical protein
MHRAADESVALILVPESAGMANRLDAYRGLARISKGGRRARERMLLLWFAFRSLQIPRLTMIFCVSMDSVGPSVLL